MPAIDFLQREAQWDVDNTSTGGEYTVMGRMKRPVTEAEAFTTRVNELTERNIKRLAPDYCQGDEILDDILACIDGIIVEPKEQKHVSELQRRVIHHFIVEAGATIYGDRWREARLRVEEKLGVSVVSSFLLLISGRRVGKSTGIAAFASSMMYCVVKLAIIIIAPVIRTGTPRWNTACGITH